MSENVKLNALKEILYGAGISFVLGMIGYVLMFFFKLIAARYFGPAQFGMYEMLMTIFGVAVVFGDFGIVSGIQRYISEYESENKKELLKGYLKFIIYVPLAFSLLVSMLVFIFSTQISGFFNFGNEFTLFLRIISLGIPMRVMNAILVNIFISKRKPFEGGLGYNVLERVVLVLGSLIIIYFNLSLIYLVAVTVLSLLTSVLTSMFF
jgi:O-antigen/teichoic acid export membrane protein